MSRVRRWLMAAVALGVLAQADDASAIPAYARTYKLPCASCHTVIPRRNEYGDAFRRRGYHLPAGDGADGDKAQGKSIAISGGGLLDDWIPEALPFSAIATMSANINIHEDPEVDPVTLGTPTLRFLFGGAYGDHLAVYASTTIRDPPDELYLHFARLFDRPELNIRVGQLIATTTLFRPNEELIAPLRISTSSVSGHTIGSGRLGAELNGIVFDRLFYAVGAAQNAGFGTPIDGYYHLGVKIGGVTFGGKEPDIDLDAPDSIWDTAHLTVGQWGYLGKVENSAGEELTTVRRLGLDAKLRISDAYVSGGAMVGVDPIAAAGRDNVSLTWMVEAAYMIVPWFTPVYQFQYQDAASFERQSMLHDVGALISIKDNLRGRARFSVSDDQVRNETVQLQLLFGL